MTLEICSKSNSPTSALSSSAGTLCLCRMHVCVALLLLCLVQKAPNLRPRDSCRVSEFCASACERDADLRKLPRDTSHCPFGGKACFTKTWRNVCHCKSVCTYVRLQSERNCEAPRASCPKTMFVAVQEFSCTNSLTLLIHMYMRYVPAVLTSDMMDVPRHENGCI